MKRRLISLLLVSVMILFCFAGCGEKTGEEIMKEIGEEASKDAVTISMYLMSEKPVSKEQEARMEAAVNDITETDFTIHVDLRYITADEYYAKLERDLAKMDIRATHRQRSRCRFHAQELYRPQGRSAD